MNNINQQLFTIYQNLDVFYEYRGLVSIDEKLENAKFAQTIQRDKYLVLSAIAKSAKKGPTTRTFVTVLVYPGTLCETKWESMQRLINHIRHPNADVMFITPTKIANGVAKKLSSLSNESEHSERTFVAHSYNLLLSVVPRFELAPKYEILPETIAREFDSFTLSKISENDPQIVWIGGRVGDVIKFTYLSEVTIHAIGYCVVGSAGDLDR